MDNIQKHITSLSQPEFDRLLAWAINTESVRREQEQAQEAAQAKVIQELVQSGKIAGARYVTLEEAFEGARVPSWRDPKGDFTKMYPEGAVVSRNGDKFMSVLEGRMNSSEPGTDDSWQDVTEEIRVANLPPEERNQVDLSDEPNYFSEYPVPEIAGDNELGLQDGLTPTSASLDDPDAEPDSSA